MTSVTRSEEILANASQKSAFNYISDLSRHPEWSGGLKIEALTPGPIVVGKEYASQGEVAVQKDRPNTVRVSVYEPFQRFGFIAKDPDFGDVSHVFIFEQMGQEVSIRRTFTVNLNPFVALAFRTIIYPFVGRPSMLKSMAALKAKLESMPS